MSLLATGVSSLRQSVQFGRHFKMSTTRGDAKKLLASTTEKPISQVLAGTLIESLPEDGPPALLAHLAVAGGGSKAISALASTPNASRMLLKGDLLYSQKSFADFVAREAFATDEKGRFSFVSSASSSMLASSALKRAVSLTDWGDDDKCVGLGCTSSLRSENDRVGREYRMNVLLKDCLGNEFGYQGVINGCINREEQEELVSCVILITLMEYVQEKVKCQSKDIFGNMVRLGKTEINKHANLSSINISSNSTLEGALERLFNGTDQAVILSPSLEKKSFIAMKPSLIPPDSVIFPGSFNPIHVGHISLAEASQNIIKNLRDQEFIEHETIMKYMDLEKDSLSAKTPLVLFELSVYNADKPPLRMEEVQKRLDIFLENLKDKKYDWGVVLSTAPLFVQKVDIIEKCVTAQADNPNDSKNRRKMTFLIGSDTMVRLIDKKYYGDSTDQMIAALRVIEGKGVGFIVGGRQEQKGSSKKFVSGNEELNTLPIDLQNIFTLLSEKDFRIDISSSELRKKK